MFKLRNENGVVIGAASRMYGKSEQHGSFVEWVLHLPARGSMYITMGPNPSSNGYREGTLRAGTREFLTLQGVGFEILFFRVFLIPFPLLLPNKSGCQLDSPCAAGVRIKA